MANTSKFSVPSPYDQQMAEIQRRQKMAELMQQQGLEPLESMTAPGGMVVKTSPLLGLAKMLQVGLGSRALNAVEKQRGEAEEKARTEATDWLDSLQRGKQSFVGQPLTQDQAMEAALAPGGAPTQPTGQMVSQPYTAQERATQIQKAAFSGNPNMRLAAQLAASQKASTAPIKDIDVDKFTPESIGAFQSNFARSGAPNYSLLKPVDQKPVAVPADIQAYNFAKDQGYTGTYLDFQKELRKSGAPVTTVKVDNVGSKELVGLFANELGKRHEKASSAQGILDQVGRLENLTKSGTFTGALAPKAVGATQFLQSFGINVNPEVLANSRTFEASANNLVLDFMSANGGARGFTEKETAILMNAFPQLVDNTQARVQIASVLRDKANREIKAYNNQLQEFKSAYPDSVVPYQPIETEDEAYQRYLQSRQKPQGK